MIRLLASILLILFVQAQSSYLEEDELRSIKKGQEWLIHADTATFSVSYDIWKNTFSLYNTSSSQSFSDVDDIFRHLRRTYNLREVSIQQRKTGKKTSDVFLVDIVSKFIDRFKKRTIKL